MKFPSRMLHSVFISIEQRVWHADRGRSLPRTPGHIQLGTCIYLLRSYKTLHTDFPWVKDVSYWFWGQMIRSQDHNALLTKNGLCRILHLLSWNVTHSLTQALFESKMCALIWRIIAFPLTDSLWKCPIDWFILISTYILSEKRNDTQLPLVENKTKYEECGIGVKLLGNRTKFIDCNYCFRR